MSNRRFGCLSGAGVSVQGVTWQPTSRRRPTLSNINLDIEPGQRVLLAGPSGSGKSTLLRALAGLLLSAGHGELTGTITVGGQPVGAQPGRVGLLLPDPGAAVVAATCGRDVAFGPENRAVPRAEIWRQVRDALAEARFPYDVGRATAALSGGELQRLALAGTLVLGSEVILLDEPTSMLDPDTAGSVRASLQHSIADRGVTAVIVEHRLDPWLDFVDRLIVMGPGGHIIADGEPRLVLADQATTLTELGVWVPGAAPPELPDIPAELVAPAHAAEGMLLKALDLGVQLRPGWASRDRTPVAALDGVDATVTGGRTLAITGSSGAGKSTLLGALAGLVTPSSGTLIARPEWDAGRRRGPVRWRSRDLAARLAWMPQLPEVGVVAKTVYDEALATTRALDRNEKVAGHRATDLLEVLGLSHLAGASPYHLSGGEQRRLMAVAALTHGPNCLLLDEPTVGQDRLTWAALLGVCRAATDAGAGIALSTHDQTAVEAVADDRLRLHGGREVAT